MNMQEVDYIIEMAQNSRSFVSDINYSKIKVGIDLGTCYVVAVVLSEDNQPIACEMEYCQIVKDGLVVDYMGAVDTVKRLKEKLEKRLGFSLEHAAIAVPSNTAAADCATHRYVVEGAGLEVVNIADEPVAANELIKINDGVIVDIGGGTTGIAIFKDGKVISSADEATGGTHMTLVLAGNRSFSYEDAEAYKKVPENSHNVLVTVTPVIEKIASIIKRNITGYDVSQICLVGGPCCLKGIENIIYKSLKIPVIKPKNPLFVTPIGIAMTCESRRC